MFHLSRRTSTAALGLTLLLVGCSPDGLVGPPPDGPAASSPDQLIERFAAAYGGRDPAAYEPLLHPDFSFHFALVDQHRSDTGGVWSRAQELRSAWRMLGGSTGHENAGRPHPAVSSLKVDLRPLGGWEPRPEKGADAWQRLYFATLHVVYEDGSRRTASGRQEFTAVPLRAEGRLRWLLLEWRDLGPPQRQPTGWGAVRARFD